MLHPTMASMHDEELLQGVPLAPPPTASRAKWFVAGVTATMLIVVGVVTMSNMSKPDMRSKVDAIDSTQLYSTIDSTQPLWQIVTKERDLCSDYKSNCFDTKCCKTTGYYCFQKGPGDAKCMKSCKKGVDSPTCAVATTRVSFQEGEANSLFCFSVYTKDTGSPKPSYELELVTQQFAQKVSIFACDAFDVYSDVSVDIGGLQTIKVDDVKGDFHFQKRKETGAWVNTGMFKQIWKAIGEKGTYKNFDWTVKVDPDAVFLPHRLIQRIKWIPRLEHGVVLVNCKLVDNGFFGNLEVYSANAFSVLVDNVDKCDASIPWKIGVKNGKYGPMGEDLFAEKCMEKNGVAKVEAFDITKDGACPANRPKDQEKNKKWKPVCKDAYTSAMHPFKTPIEYFKCLEDTTPLQIPQ